MAEANRTKTHIKANIKVTLIKAVPTNVIVVSITTHVEDIIKVIVTANLEAEAMAMVKVITIAVAMAGPIIEATIINNYHQYYGYDDDYQPEQYGPPCALCSRYNHSPKHCFKGENDINNIMEKMNISRHQSQRSSLYQ